MKFPAVFAKVCYDRTMSTITITLPDEQLLQLTELAQVAGVAPEELLRANIEAWLTQPRADFAQAADYLLRKNHELYQRLA